MFGWIVQILKETRNEQIARKTKEYKEDFDKALKHLSSVSGITLLQCLYAVLLMYETHKR